MSGWNSRERNRATSSIALRIADHLFEGHAVPALGRDFLQEHLDIAMAEEPNQFGQLSWRPSMRSGEKRREEEVELGLFEGGDYCAGLSNQMNESGVLEVVFCPLKHREIESIIRCLVDEDSVPQPVLHHPVELLHRHAALLAIVHESLGRFRVNAADLHNGPDRTVDPEPIPLRSKGLFPFRQSIEIQ